VYRSVRDRTLEEKARQKLPPPPAAIHISVDEVSYRKYHRYLTNVIDTDRKLLIWNQKGRKSEVLNQYFEGIGKDGCQKIETVARDGPDIISVQAPPMRSMPLSSMTGSISCRNSMALLMR
jgi:transposase